MSTPSKLDAMSTYCLLKDSHSVSITLLKSLLPMCKVSKHRADQLTVNMSSVLLTLGVN